MLDLKKFLTIEGQLYSIQSSKSTDSSLIFLKKIYDKNILALSKFDDVSLNLLNFDWCDNGQDRNWWWQLQSFPFLAHYRNAFSLLSEFEKKVYLIKCLDTIVNWVKNAGEKTPLKWHDHATAFRLRNLLQWASFCVKNELTVHLQAEQDLLYNLILEHCEWLLLDKNYSKHTNHGFDQSMILLLAGLMINHKKSSGYIKVSTSRLIDEIDFAFTNEGVHKENSPGYQKFMYQRLVQLDEFKVFEVDTLSSYVIDLIKKSRNFLSVITMPNGMLPMIGDTLYNVPGLASPLGEIKVYDYSKSGYVVVKGFIKDKDFFLLFKNTHESNYHRHDDDLSIFLYYNGKVILADGGLGSHNEKSLERKTIRSSLNHNSILLGGVQAIRDKTHLSKKPIIRFITPNSFYGESYMFGQCIRREIDIENINKGIIRIKDYTFNNVAKINFISEQEVGIEGNNFCIDGKCDLKLLPSIEDLHNTFLNKNSALISRSYLNYEKITNFGWNVCDDIGFDIILRD